MRVLLLSDFYPPVAGGLEFHVRSLATYLTSMGDEVRIATLTRNPEPSNNVRIHSIRSLSSHVLPYEDVSRQFHPPCVDPLTRRDLTEVIERFSPDVIHAHSWIGASAPKSGPPIIFTAHDYSLVCQLRTLRYCDGSNCSGPAISKCMKCGVATYGTVKSALMTVATRTGRAGFTPNEILAVSDSVRRALSPYTRIPISVVPNFIPDALATASLPANFPSGAYVMYAGDPGQHKGVGDLSSIWADGDLVGARLVMATTRPPTVRLPPNVFVATLSRAQVMTAFARARVAVVPSLWPEPCPTVVLEAMAAGVPVVGYDSGGIPELARHGIDGLIVARGDVAALRQALITLLSDEALRRTMGANARARAVEFTASVVGSQIRRHYGAAIRGRAGAALIGTMPA